jgi:(p)ppGpp synthase/HD superfamily hydrolase
MNYVDWCIEQHRKTNHFYDRYLPYEFHLRMVNNVYEDFQHLLDEELNEYCSKAVWGHDLIEDTRVSYNDVKNQLDEGATDIIYAVTNDKGKNRKERAGDKYYEGIRNTPGAVFVKLCDRIANVQYGKMTKSRMFEMYKKENDDFIVQLGWDRKESHPYGEMFRYLNNLFND